MLTLPVLWEHMILDESVLPTVQALSAAMRLGSEHMGSRFLRGMMIDAPIVARAQQTIDAAIALGLGREA